MQPETADEKLVSAALGALGCSVERVATGIRQSCDYLIDHGAYLLEVKARTDPDELWSATGRGDMFERAKEIDISSRVDEIIDDAVKQLRETQQAHPAQFLLVAVVIRPVFSRDAEYRRVLGSLYGIQRLLHMDVPNDRAFLECFYFRRSRFMMHPALNGAIVFLGSDKWTLCVNDRATNSAHFRESRLFHAFSGASSVFDPALYVDGVHVLIADPGMPWTNPAAMKAAIAQKYQLGRVLPLDPTEYSATVAMPDRRPARSRGSGGSPEVV